MPQHSANEQYLLELINAERAKAGVQPLAFDNDLSESAEGHSRWMLAYDIFSHSGSGGSTSTQRMKAAGYVLQGSWATGENIAWATIRAPAGYQDEVKLLHTNLMNSSGHRANILNGNFREVGLGFEVGDYRGRNSAMLTENFGKTGTDLFLTGVAFDDQDGDRFYDPGEGLSGINVTARSSTGLTYDTTTMSAGGYDLALKAGTYTVTFSGPGIATSTQTVTIGTRNVKRDLIDPAASTTTVAADETGEEPAPTSPTTDPMPSDGGSTTATVTGTNWLTQFFSRWGTAVRGESEEGSTDLVQDQSLPPPAGDQLQFRSSSAASDMVEEIGDVFDGMFASLAPDSESLTAVIDAVPVHVAEAVDSALAKVLAQLGAGHAGQHSDLLV